MAQPTNNTSQEEGNLLYIRNLTPYFDQENAQARFRQLDAGFARHDPRYHKLSLYISSIPAQTINSNGLCEWRFSIPLRNLELQANKFFRVRSLRRYYKKADRSYGYFSSDAGFAIIHEHNDKQFMNVFLHQLPAQTQNKDGVLQYRFEILLFDRQKQTAAPEFPSPNPCENESPDEDIPF